MKVNPLGIFVLVILLALACACSSPGPSVLPTEPTAPTPAPRPETTLKLPEPRLKSAVSLEEALFKRRSIREYSDLPFTLEEVSQLLWAAQGVTSEWGGRTAPSAGALYPLELYLVVGNVDNLPPGVYKYRPKRHELVGQAWIKEGAIDIVIAAVYERTTRKYGDRGVRYVHMEAGHAAQNIYLQAAALDLGMVTVGAFHDDRVKEITGMLEDEIPLYVIPVGRKT